MLLGAHAFRGEPLSVSRELTQGVNYIKNNVDRHSFGYIVSNHLRKL